MRRPFRVGACQLGIRALGLDNPVIPSVFKLLSSYVRNMPSRKEPRTPAEKPVNFSESYEYLRRFIVILEDRFDNHL